MINFKKIVVVTCPTCGFQRNAELRGRGLIRECRSCTLKAARKNHIWASVGIHHQQTKTPLYRVWNAMKQRCDTPTSDVYVDYGGRGISYCSEWSDFLPFKAWADANGYEKGLMLDRENNDGNYEPSNCRWTTPIKSAFNRRTNKNTLAEIAVIKSLYEMGVKHGIIMALFGISLSRFSDIRETDAWKRMDPLFLLSAESNFIIV